MKLTVAIGDRSQASASRGAASSRNVDAGKLTTGLSSVVFRRSGNDR